jgi:hypothetical protein
VPKCFYSGLSANVLGPEGLSRLQEASRNVFELLLKPVIRLIEKKGFPKPT